MASSVMLALTLAHLLITFACGQINNTSPETCPVTQTQQLTVNGCPVFVHDVTGTKNFVVEPLLCITRSLGNLLPQFDPLSQKVLVSVPVTLRDDAMLAQIKNQLQHLSPNSVKFAPVSKISVSTDASSTCVQALMFIWNPNKEFGYLRLGAKENPASCGKFFLYLKDSIFDIINGVTATAEIELGSVLTELKYKVMVQNQKFFYPEFYGSKLEYESNCDNLQLLRSVIVGKCVAQVYQRQGASSRYYIEPLLCPRNDVTSELITYDYSRDMYYLKLDVVLQDDDTLNAVKSKLAHLSPGNVSFLQLWRVEIAVSSLLRSRFAVGPLMVSGDWRSGQMRVYCKKEDDCKNLRSNMVAIPLSFWSHVNFELTSHIPNQCIVRSERFYYNTELTDIYSTGKLNSNAEILTKLNLVKKHLKIKTIDGRHYAIIQQRMSDSVSFQRTWDEYEAGFGDDTTFWIGLSTIHLLSISGTSLRVETKLMNGIEYYREYADFKVGDASTNYTLTIGELIASRSNDGKNTVKFWLIHNGMQFSTMDRDNDNFNVSCSLSRDGEKGGWWFNSCANDNPNYGIFRHRFMAYIDYLHYVGESTSELRLMLQI